MSKMISGFFLAEGLIPPVMILGMYLLDSLIFPPGAAKSLTMVVLYCLAILLPTCLISGSLFTMLATRLSVIKGKNELSPAYGWESAGSLIAGLLFSIILVYLLSTFQILAILLMINVMFAAYLYPSKSAWKTRVLTGILLLSSVALFLSPADKRIRSIHFKNQEMLYTRDSPYGNITVTKTAGQHNFFENYLLLFSTADPYFPEEAVHFALLQQTYPQNVLIVSGGIGGMTRQVGKYKSVQHIHYVEINPWLVAAERDFGEISNESRLKVITQDARSWIKNSDHYYDVVLVNTPDPSNAQLNRYYTLEFFTEVKQALKSKGVFSIALSPTVNYMSDEAAAVNRILYNTLKQVFREVKIVPGERNYFIASDDAVGINFAGRMKKAGFENDYVNPDYLDDGLLAQNNRQMMDRIGNETGLLNRDLSPLAYFLQLKYWMSIYQNNGRRGPGIILALILMFALIFVLLLLRKSDSMAIGVFTCGFAGAAVEFLVLILYQARFGSVFQMLGIVVGIYMAGLTAGAVYRSSKDMKGTVRSYVIAQFAMFLLVLVLPFLAVYLFGKVIIPDWLTRLLLFGIVAGVAFVAGLVFNKASKLAPGNIEKRAGNLYSIDLMGAASGTLLVSLICFPLLGLWTTCVTMAGLILTGIIVTLLLPARS
jgi:spermidine synthase